MTKIIELPNIRKLFIPDPGYTLFDCDLKGADAQVVAWEADDEDLKAAFRAGVDIHEHNAEAVLGSAFTKLQGTARRIERQRYKHAVHGTNYGGRPKAIAMHPSINWTIHEAEQFQKRWFDIHPGIKENFHEKTMAELRATKSATNAFGYRRIFFDRIDDCFTEALAWKPQSTVALITFKGAIKLYYQPAFRKPGFESDERAEWAAKNHIHYSYIDYLMQVHDSLVFQLPNNQATKIAEVKEGLQVVVPYADPLIIPWEIATSTKSWGDKVKLKDV